MKNATKHADDLRSLFRKLMKDCKPEPRQPQDPLHALVRGAMSFDVPDARAEEAMKVVGQEFVDLNELRVATELEVQDLLGSRYPEIVRRVMMITQALNNIFEREHTLSLDRLKTISKRDARQFLRELPDVHPFVEAYVMLMAFDGHAVPIDDQTLAYLKAQGIVEENTSLDEAQRFVEHAVKAEECHDLYGCLRRQAQAHAEQAEEGPRKKRK
jgi:endonuclease III